MLLCRRPRMRKCASTKNCSPPRRAVFFISPQIRATLQENARLYDGHASGGLLGGVNLHLYVKSNPIMKFDAHGKFPSGPGDFPNTPDTSVCEYYSRVGQSERCNYHKTAYGICKGSTGSVYSVGANVFARGCALFSDGATVTQTMNCIRTCLVISDNMARSMSDCKLEKDKECGGGGVCTKRSCIDGYHNYCFKRCGINSLCYGGRWDDFLPPTWAYDD